MNEKRLSTDAVEWAYQRYIKNDPKRIAHVELIREQSAVAQEIYDKRSKLRMTREALAEISGLTPEAIEDLEESDYDGSWEEAIASIKRAFHQLEQGDHEKRGKAKSKDRTTEKFTLAELISQIARKTKRSEDVVGEVLTSLFKRNRGITIEELGTFSLVKKAARTRANHRAKAKVKKPAGKVPTFLRL